MKNLNIYERICGAPYLFRDKRMIPNKYWIELERCIDAGPENLRVAPNPRIKKIYNKNVKAYDKNVVEYWIEKSKI